MLSWRPQPRGILGCSVQVCIEAPFFSWAAEIGMGSGGAQALRQVVHFILGTVGGTVRDEQPGTLAGKCRWGSGL